MQLFLATLTCILTMLLYGVPGFLTMKLRLFKEENIAVFSLLLMNIFAPAMNLDAFVNGEFTTDAIGRCLLFFAIGIVVQCSVMTLSYLLLRKKYDDTKNKILTLAVVLGNCGFVGIPILRAALPDYPLAVPMSTFYALGMNILIYTVGFFVISGDRKYVSPKRLFLNPATISILSGFLLMILRLTTGWNFPDWVCKALSVMGGMSSPLCLFIIGMRLATMHLGKLFLQPVVYKAIAFKQIIVPLAVFGLLTLLPLETGFKQTLFVMACVPVASMVLMASEVIGEGQREAASIVLVSTLSSVITIPLLMLLWG